MVDKYLEAYGQTRSSDTLRKHYLPYLMNIGLLDEEPDPVDKRKIQYRVLRTEILDEKSGDYLRFKSATIFSPEILKDALDELKTNRGLTPRVYAILMLQS